MGCKYHGHGSSEPGHLSSDMMKQFLPEQQRTERIVGAVKTVSNEVGRSMAQVAPAWLPPLPTRGGHPHYRGAKALAIAG
jgi:hypothetical protein